MKKIITLSLSCLFLSISLFAQNEFYDSARFDVDEALAPFYHGVASGDPQ
ncbi:MAG: hypothetical protein ACI94Y_004416, partial [Maribacter sp.]